MQNELIDDDNDFVIKEVENPKQCNHNLYFLYPGNGKYDIYKCKNCHDSVIKSWEDTGTTTYKDRVPTISF